MSQRVLLAKAVLVLVLAGVFDAILPACRTVSLEPHHPPEEESLRVMSFNAHFADLTGGEEAVTSHARDVALVIREIKPDIAGLQEVATADYPDYVRPDPFVRNLTELLPDYGWICPCGASVLSQSNPILYRKDRFLPNTQGIEWFSPEPSVPDSTGWGNELPRYFVWATFFDASTHRHITVLNVHLDHITRRMNRLAIERLIELCGQELDERYVVLLGDFNEPATGGPRSKLSEHLEPVITPLEGPTMSGVPPIQIDGIYVGEQFIVSSARVVRGSGLIKRTSDHRPVVADLIYKHGVSNAD